MLKLSPSTINLFMECPRCFWNHFHNKKRPDIMFSSLPSGMDHILKKYFDYFRNKNSVPPEIEKIGAKLFDESILKIWQNNFKGISWQDPKTNVILRGAVDEILVKDEKLIVLDFKTRGFPIKENTTDYYKTQLDLYNFLLKKNNRKVADYSYLLFYHPKEVFKGRKCYIEFNYDLIKIKANPSKAEKIFKDAVACLQLKKPPKSAKDCKWCKYFFE